MKIKLYRGDPQYVDKFTRIKKIGYLLGPGIYLTTSTLVAEQFGIGSEIEQFKSIKDVINDWMRQFVRINRDSLMKYRDDKTELLNVLKTEWKRHSPVVIKHANGTYGWYEKTRTSHISVFEFDQSYLKRTIDADEPMPPKILLIIRNMLGDNRNRPVDLRDDEEKMMKFDDWIKYFRKDKTRYAWSETMIGGEGKSPSFDEFVNGTHFGFSFMNDRWDDFINQAMTAGYVGFRFKGGDVGSGTGARGGGPIGHYHDVYCLWDADVVNDCRVDVKISTPSTLSDQDIERYLKKMSDI
ncbi:MAG: hypothetical protein WC284_11490 [Candidimonas sp.]